MVFCEILTEVYKILMTLEFCKAIGLQIITCSFLIFFPWISDFFSMDFQT